MSGLLWKGLIVAGVSYLVIESANHVRRPSPKKTPSLRSSKPRRTPLLDGSDRAAARRAFDERPTIGRAAHSSQPSPRLRRSARVKG